MIKEYRLRECKVESVYIISFIQVMYRAPEVSNANTV